MKRAPEGALQRAPREHRVLAPLPEAHPLQFVAVMRIAIALAAVLATTTACSTHIPHPDEYRRSSPSLAGRTASAQDCGPAESLPATPYEQIYFEEAAALSKSGSDLFYAGSVADAEATLLLSLFADPYRVDTHAVLAELYAVADRPGCVAIMIDRIADMGAYPSRATDVATAAVFLRGALGLAGHIDDPRVYAAASRLGAQTGVDPSSFGADAPGEIGTQWHDTQLVLVPALPVVPAV